MITTTNADEIAQVIAAQQVRIHQLEAMIAELRSDLEEAQGRAENDALTIKALTGKEPALCH